MTSRFIQKRSKGKEEAQLVERVPSKGSERSLVVDEANGDEITPKEIPTKRGYLKKENRKGKFQQRYMSTNNWFFNYHRRRRGSKKKRALQSVDLREATDICVLLKYGKPSTKFAIQRRYHDAQAKMEECLFFKASTVADAQDWVNVLNIRKAYWDLQGKVDPKLFLLDFEKKRQETINEQRLLLETIVEDEGYLQNLLDKNKVERYGSADLSDDYFDEDGYWDSANVEGKEDESNDDFDDDNHDDEEDFFTTQEYESDDSESDLSDDEDKIDLEALNYNSDGNESQLSTSSEKYLLPGVIVLLKKFGFEEKNQLKNTIYRVPRGYPRQYWHEPNVNMMRVRGPSYLKDKIKVQASTPLFRLIAVDLFETPNGRFDNVANDPGNRVYLANDRGENHGMFVLNVQVPGPPFYCFVCYFMPADQNIADLMKACLKKDCDVNKLNFKKLENENQLSESFVRLFYTFFGGKDDSIRDSRFKLLPRILEGPWIVRSLVPQKPALIGLKIKQRYFVQDHYFELDLDVGSQSVANQCTKLAANKAKLLTIDLALLLECRSDEELKFAEKCLGIVRINHLDFADAFKI